MAQYRLLETGQRDWLPGFGVVEAVFRFCPRHDIAILIHWVYILGMAWFFLSAVLSVLLPLAMLWKRIFNLEWDDMYPWSSRLGCLWYLIFIPLFLWGMNAIFNFMIGDG